MSPVLAEKVLGYSWWLVFPPFVVLVTRLSIERACADAYDLLPAVTSNPDWAWPLAAVYVAGHLWLLTRYGVAVSLTDKLLPGTMAFASTDRLGAWKSWSMIAALALEYCPVSLWRLLGAGLHCRG